MKKIEKNYTCRITAFTCVLLFALFTTGCDEFEEAANNAADNIENLNLNNSTEEQLLKQYADLPKLKIMTRNLALGASVQSLMDITALSVAMAALESLLNVVTTSDIQTRVKAIATEIQTLDPDVIGLQEVIMIRQQSPGDFFDTLATNTLNSEIIVIDFLTELMDALTEKNLHYQVVTNGIGYGVDIEAPGQERDLRLTDRDILLVKEGLTWENEKSVTYNQNLKNDFTMGPSVFSIIASRSFSKITLNWESQKIDIYTTHLEVPSNGSDIQKQQAKELISDLSGEHPAIFLGDFNAPPGSETYKFIVDQSLTDTWVVLSKPETSTCCFNLTNETQLFKTRIDHVFFKSTEQVTLIAIAATVTQQNKDEMVQRTTDSSYTWASDHAGLLTQFVIPSE